MTRHQPICAGTDASGELVWSEMPMALWQILRPAVIIWLYWCERIVIEENAERLNVEYFIHD